MPPSPAPAPVAPAPAARRPNIVVIVSDDQTAFDLGCYGNTAVHTPNLDRLARDGVRFEHAFVTSPQCSPSRASILTGRSPVAIGMSRLHAPLRPSIPSVLEPLKKAGYYVASYRKVHLGDDFQKRWDYAGGFDEAPSTIFSKRPKDRPLFLWVGFEDPHRPYHPNAFTPPHDPAKVIVPAFLPDTKKVRRDLADYYDAIARMDRETGELLDALDAAGLTDDTFVTFASDNGMPFPGAKGSLYDPGIHVPLLVRWPGHVKPGGVDKDLVSLVDLPATWLDVANIAIPAEMEGRSTLPRIVDAAAGRAGPSPSPREAVFIERDWHDTQDAVRAVRTKRYSLIQNYRAEIAYAPTFDLRDSSSWQSIVELHKAGTLAPALVHRYFTAPRASVELYDLEADKDETRNLVGSAAHAGELKRHQELLSRWMASTNDFLPPPVAAHVGRQGQALPTPP
ncbi:MAG TPA: sulfatase [Labilithrix sp.]|nr:sulfatase [Labilithrix sp.]